MQGKLLAVCPVNPSVNRVAEKSIEAIEAPPTGDLFR